MSGYMPSETLRDAPAAEGGIVVSGGGDPGVAGGAASPDLRDPQVLEGLLLDFLRRRDWRGVEAALTLLSSANARRAQLLYDAMRVGLALRRERRETQEP